MLKEFKKFALRGNVVDLAVGVIIGAAFGTIVTSLVGDIIMPVIWADLRRTGLLELLFTPVRESTVRPFLCRCEKAGSRARLGPVFDGYPQLPDHCLGSVLGDPGHQQIEKRRACCTPRSTAEEKLLTEIRDLLKK